MNFNKLSPTQVSKLRAEITSIPNFKHQIALINLQNESDPSAILHKDNNPLLIASDLHSYAKSDRIFTINQDENTVFAQYVYQDSKRNKYKRVLDTATGSGVIAMASAKAGVQEVIAGDINKRCKEFIKINNKLNRLSVKFLESNLFKNTTGKFDKITFNPPFMPAPQGTFPLHAQGGEFGVENVIIPFLKNCFKHLNKGGVIQAIFHSFADDKHDIVLDLINKYAPEGWSYSIKHVFPVKNIPIELYTTCFIEHEGYEKWLKKIQQRKLKYMRFFMVTLRQDGKSGLRKEEFSKPRLYNLIYPPTTLHYLSKYNLKTGLLSKPLSEKEYPNIGHLVRLSRYNYFIYSTLMNLFKEKLV